MWPLKINYKHMKIKYIHMKKYLLILLLGALFFSCDPSNEVQKSNGLFHLKNEQIGFAINTDLQGIVYKDPEIEKTRILFEEPVFAIVSENTEINFIVDKVLHDKTESLKGQASQFRIFASDNQNSGILLEIKLIVPEINKNVLMTQVTLTNKSGQQIQVDKLICHRYTLKSQDGDTRQGEAPFWAFCGGTYPERFDWIEPMHQGFYRQNDMATQAGTQYSGGNPYTGIWNPQFGIGIMSLETRQAPLAFPVKSEQEGIVKISIEEPVEKMLDPGEVWISTRHAVLVHEGDAGNGLAVWSELLQQQGLEFPQSPESCFESIWCGWGYEDDYTSAELISTIPVARELGLKWVVVDAGWYDRDTFWELHPEKYPLKDISMRAFTDSVKALGMRPKLWFIPSTAPYGWPEGRYGKKGELIVPDEAMLLLNKENESVDLTWFGVSLLCPAYEPVAEANRAFVRKAMVDWGFDGFKIDGEYLNKFPPCYNTAHGHEDPLESTYAGSQLLEAMY
jgi:alpha-galactosidase